MIFASNSARISRSLNAIALSGVTGVLCFAFAWQFFNGDATCPLCELQRAAFLLAGVGLLLNLRLGPAPMHYAMTIGAALAGMAVAGWQILRHSAGSVPAIEATLLDWPLYSWAFLAFSMLVAYCAIMLVADRKWSANALKRPMSAPALLLMVLFFLISLAHVGVSVLGVGWGPCPQADEYCETTLLSSVARA